MCLPCRSNGVPVHDVVGLCVEDRLVPPAAGLRKCDVVGGVPAPDHPPARRDLLDLDVDTCESAEPPKAVVSTLSRMIWRPSM